MWRELERSRRYEHPFVIARIRRERSAEEAARFAEVLRKTDAVWVDGSQVYVLLCESDRSMAEALLERLPAVLPDVSLDGARMAAFPEDGLTTGALLAALDAPAPDVLVVSVGSDGEDDLTEALSPRHYLDDAGLAPQQP